MREGKGLFSVQKGRHLAKGPLRRALYACHRHGCAWLDLGSERRNLQSDALSKSGLMTMETTPKH